MFRGPCFAAHVPPVRMRREALIFHQGANRTPLSAIRKGKYKLIKHWMAGGDCNYCGEKLLELYDLGNDLGETTDLSGQMPELTASLHAELMAFLDQANAETKSTDRVADYNLLLRKRGISPGNPTMIEPEYVSPFTQE